MSQRNGIRLDVAAAIFAAVAAIASALIALKFLEHEQHATEVSQVRTTIDTLMRHRREISNLQFGHVCLISYVELPPAVQEGINGLRGSEHRFICEKDWCKWYRRCVGEEEAELPDGTVIEISDTHGWDMGLQINRTIESYARLSLLYGQHVVDKRMFREFLEFELRFDSPVVRYFLSAQKIFNIAEQNSCLSRLISDINIVNGKVPKEWRNMCSNKGRHDRVRMRRLRRIKQE